MRIHPKILVLTLDLLAAGACGQAVQGKVGSAHEAGAAATNAAPPTISLAAPPTASLAAYEAHLQALVPVVEQCAAARNVEGCDPGRVGADDSVEAPGMGTREVRYDWLRNLLEQAQQPDEKTAPNAAKTSAAAVKEDSAKSGDEGNGEPGPRTPVDAIRAQVASGKTTSELLADAVARLKFDQDEAQHLGSSRSGGHPREHEALRQVLAQGIYSDLGEEPKRSRALEKLGEWVNAFFDGLNRAGMSMPWLGRALMILFFIVVGALLIWSMIQNERRLRLRLVPDGLGMAAGAPSARGWELWWSDAESAARQAQWREAVHFVYWASIARLEQMRLWPADKARTPREYLRLLKADDPRRAGLLQLTRSFERTWYGGRDADESACQNAMSVARALMEAGGKR